MTDLRQAAQQALDALAGELLKMLDKPEDEQYRVKYAYLLTVITALRTALEQKQAEPVQENQVLIEWKEQGEVIMAQAGVGFRLGVWWADRPWRYVSEFADQRFDVAQQSWTDDLKAALKEKNSA